jgi:Arc/MetJ family transcription regulator
MSRRNPPRRARQPLCEMVVNAHGDIVDLDEKYDDPPVDLAMLSLVSEHVAADNENAAPRAARGKRGKYNTPLTYEQREKIIGYWMDGWTAPKIIKHFALDSVSIKRSTLDSMLRRLRREDRISLITVRRPR